MNFVEPAISLTEVSKRYLTGRRPIVALNGVSVAIEEGEYVTISGPSGCGKSTLLNLLTGIDVQDTGQVHILGKNIRNMGQDALALWRGREVGIVFQFFQLMPTLTVRENVMLPMDLARWPGDRSERVATLLDQVGLVGLENNLPSELSGGEQQRVAIARALANQPRLLVADEPTGNLDTANGNQIIELLESFWISGTTLIVVTHDRELAGRAPRQIGMRDGQIVEDFLPVHHLALNADPSQKNTA